MNFKDIYINREERFSVGIEEDSQKYYLSIPVSYGVLDYEEYYEIDQEDFEKFFSEHEHLRKIAEACRERKNDSRLII